MELKSLKRVTVYPFILILSFATFCDYVECNTISSERTPQLSAEDTDYPEVTNCQNEFDSTYCETAVRSGSCAELDDDSPIRFGCKKSCGLCEDEQVDGYPDQRGSSIQESYSYFTTDDDGFTLDDPTEDPLGKGGCEDKIPNCSNYVSQCCSMKEAMNTSCSKTCKFCSESPATAPPSSGIGVPAPTPTASSNQDPCDPTKPPSGNVDVPGQTTTTTQSPIGNLPSAATLTLPGQTTTTTTQSPIGPGYPPIG